MVCAAILAVFSGTSIQYKVINVTGNGSVMDKGIGFTVAAFAVVLMSYLIARIDPNIEFGSIVIVALGVVALISVRIKNHTV